MYYRTDDLRLITDNQKKAFKFGKKLHNISRGSIDVKNMSESDYEEHILNSPRIIANVIDFNSKGEFTGSEIRKIEEIFREGYP